MKKYKEVILELSKNCNLNCIMCGYGAKYNKPGHFMDFALFDDILKQVNGGFEVLRLNGRGESTIHPGFVRFIRHARGMYPDGRLRLFTNMNYRDDDITTALADCGCETMISLDSVDRQKLEHIRAGASYETVMRNIGRLCAASKLTAIVFTLQPDNFFELYDAARFAFENGCHFFCNAVRNVWMDEPFAKLVNGNMTYLKDTYAAIYSLFKGSEVSVHLPAQIAGAAIGGTAQATCADFTHCPNAGRDICIYYDGTVTPCGMFNPYVLGNIKEGKLDDITGGSRFAQFTEAQARDPYCKNCQYMCS